MKLAIVLCFIVFGLCSVLGQQHHKQDEKQEKLPTVLIVTLFRNKAHTLPYFLTYLEQLDYAKDRITLW